MYSAEYPDQVDLASFDMAKPPGRTYKYFTGTPLFPFGAGTSLTTFDMKCSRQQLRVGHRNTSDTSYGFGCSVQNTGAMRGDEVVMVFHRPTAATRAQVKHTLPIKQLVDFGRITIPAGATGTLQFTIPVANLAVSTDNGEKQVFPGSHELVFWRGVGAEQTFIVTV